MRIDNEAALRMSFTNIAGYRHYIIVNMSRGIDLAFACAEVRKVVAS